MSPAAGMTILQVHKSSSEKYLPRNRIVIPTGAQRSGGTCGHLLYESHPL
jgi:hypothetical protein